MPGVILKHFTACDVFTRWQVLEVHHRATAHAAAAFVDTILARVPFKVEAIQVDGGSELMAQFEVACKERGIRLFVLPPHSPKLNGHVERAQRTHKEEFYNAIDWPDSIADLRRLLREHETVYNVVRPHQSLAYLTPLQFLQHHYKQKTDHDLVVAARLLSYTQYPSIERRSV